MARKFDVIELDGSRGPQLKKSVALLLVRRLVAVHVSPFVIRRVPLRACPAVLPRVALVPKSYIPAELPPVEVSAHKFADPEKNQAKLRYRWNLVRQARHVCNFRGRLTFAAEQS